MHVKIVLAIVATGLLADAGHGQETASTEDLTTQAFTTLPPITEKDSADEEKRNEPENPPSAAEGPPEKLESVPMASALVQELVTEYVPESFVRGPTEINFGQHSFPSEVLPSAEPLVQYRAEAGGYRNNSVPEATIFVTMPPQEVSSEDEIVNDVEADWRPDDKLPEQGAVLESEPLEEVTKQEEAFPEPVPVRSESEATETKQLNEDNNSGLKSTMEEMAEEIAKEVVEEVNRVSQSGGSVDPPTQINPNKSVEYKEDEYETDEDRDIGAEESQHTYSEDAVLFFESKRNKANKKKKIAKEPSFVERMRNGNVKITSYVADIDEVESTTRLPSLAPIETTTPRRGDADMISTFFVAARDSLDPPVTPGRIRKKIIKPIRVRGKPHRNGYRGGYRGQATYRRRVVSTTTTTPQPTTTLQPEEYTTDDVPVYLPIEQISPPAHYVPISHQSMAMEVNHNMPTTTEPAYTEPTENYPKHFPSFPKKRPTVVQFQREEIRYQTPVPETYPTYVNREPEVETTTIRKEEIHLKPELSEDSNENEEAKPFEETNQADNDGLTSSDTILAPISAAVSLSNHVEPHKRSKAQTTMTIEQQEIRAEPVYKTTIEIQKSIPFEIKEEQVTPTSHFSAYSNQPFEQEAGLENSEFLQQVALAYHRLSNHGEGLPQGQLQFQHEQGFQHQAHLALHQEQAQQHLHEVENQGLGHEPIQTDQQLQNEHLPQVHLQQEHLQQEHLQQEHLQQEHLQQEHLPQEHLSQEHLPQEHLPEQVFQHDQAQFQQVGLPQNQQQQVYYLYRGKTPQLHPNLFLMPLYKPVDYRPKGHVGQYIMQQSYKNIERPKQLYRPYYYQQLYDLAYQDSGYEGQKSEPHHPDPPVNTQPYPYGYGLPYYTLFYQTANRQNHPYRFETIKYLPRTGRAPFRPSEPVYTSQYPPQTYVVAMSARDARSLKQLCVEYGGFKPPLVPSVQIDETLPQEKSDN